MSIHQTVIDNNLNDAVKYVSVREFVKLSAGQLSELTGKKINTRDKILFAIAKFRIKDEPTKHPDLQVTKPHFFKRNSPFQKALFWVSIGLFALLLLSILIFGLAPR